MPENRKNPFEGVTDFFNELRRMREVGARGGEHSHEDAQRTLAQAWVPATDIFARGDDLVIRIDVAGLRPEDVDITFSHEVLTVSGERRTELGAESFYIRERFHGAFRRSITLPEGTEPSQIGAEFYNGLLELTVRGGCAGAPAERIPVRDRSTEPASRSLG